MSNTSHERALRRCGPGATVRPVDAALWAERPPERRNGRSPSATVEAPWRCGSARSSRNRPHTPQVEEEARAPRGPRRATCGMEEATGGRAGRRRSGQSGWRSPRSPPAAGRGRLRPSGWSCSQPRAPAPPTATDTPAPPPAPTPEPTATAAPEPAATSAPPPAPARPAAVDFSLPSAQGPQYTLSSFAGQQPVVVVFYRAFW